ncbi:hypothetical protein JCM11641_001483 [Rhodosporidiobolus odoratus]
MSSSADYPPRAGPVRQQSRTPLLSITLSQPGPLDEDDDDEEPTPSSPLLNAKGAGRRGSSGSASGSVDERAGATRGAGGSIADATTFPSSSAEDPQPQLTPLDLTLERIGVGRYQKQLLILCGLGWAADNMWLQCIAVILPRVQKSFRVEDQWIGLLSTSTFAGMMVGACGWGSYSDAYGRLPAFNLTLLLTAIFGVASAFAPSFGWLCFALFLLGTGVGGSMPTDGTLFLENIPKTSHFLLTGLSVFFSLGAIFTSLLGLFILPQFTCVPATTGEADCSPTEEGWRYMLGTLGIVSIAMFLARVLFFRLQESAKFLVAINRPTQAVVALRRISKMNGEDVKWALSDVIDDTESASSSGRNKTQTRTGGYETTSDTGSPPRRPSPPLSPSSDVSDLDLESDPSLSYAFAHRPARLRNAHDRPEWLDRLPSGWQPGVEDYLARVRELLGDGEGRQTTMLVWGVWGLASAGYTIFNVFLPKFLESKLSNLPESTPEQTLWDYVLYTAAGLPGSIIGAYLVETSLGRAKTLAFATLATAAGTFVFVWVESARAVVGSSMAVSLAATLMYAVIYSFTPELFSTSTRGTATGLSSALSRLSGIIAPLVTGVLLSISIQLPLLVSGVCFAATAGCAWGLRAAERRLGGRTRGAVMAH